MLGLEFRKEIKPIIGARGEKTESQSIFIYVIVRNVQIR